MNGQAGEHLVTFLHVGSNRDIYIRSILTDANLNILKEDDIPSPDVWPIGDAAIIEDQPLTATTQGPPSLPSSLYELYH